MICGECNKKTDMIYVTELGITFCKTCVKKARAKYGVCINEMKKVF